MPLDGRSPEGAPPRAVAVSATFTAEDLAPGLSFWLRQLGFDYPVRFAPYNQLFQQLLDPTSLLGRNSGVNLLLVRFEDWGVDAAGHAARLADALRHATTPVILAVCPPTASHRADCDRAIGTLRASLAAGVHLVTPDEIAALYPVDAVHDPHADELGHVPYTPLFFTALATMVARKLHAIERPPCKVIALDCDDTLWSGICGEDGPAGVILDAPRHQLQEFMRAQRSAGVLLALASKNNEEDVEETFRAHPEMPLAWGDFAARRINWEPKGANLAALAADLDLGLDTFILVDDNPKECTEAQAACPELLALPLPSDAAQIPAFLRHVWAFDHARITEEDRRRAGMYAQQAERARLERSSGSLAEFLQSLGLEVRIAPATPAQLPRMAQLTQRTNQMNLTCVRRTEAELAPLAARTLAVEVDDRFGSYGLTGVAIYGEAAGELVVDTLLLSCRVLGRGVEHRLLARLGEIAMARGLAVVALPYAATARNRPARLFLESVARPDPDGVYRLRAEDATRLRYLPGAAPRAVEPAPAAPPPAARGIDYLAIATELRTPEQIHSAIYPARGAQPARKSEGVAPRTPLEAALAAIWSDLLHVRPIGVTDDFFELGGHSLLAVQLMARVRRLCGVDLSLEVVYAGGFTVAALARAVEWKGIEQAGAGYADLLREIEEMSDDQARALLEQEQSGGAA